MLAQKQAFLSTAVILLSLLAMTEREVEPPLHAGGRIVGVSVGADSAVVTVEGSGIYLYEVSDKLSNGCNILSRSIPFLTSTRACDDSSAVDISKRPGQ